MLSDDFLSDMSYERDQRNWDRLIQVFLNLDFCKYSFG